MTGAASPHRRFHIVSFHINQDDVIPYLTDIAVGDDIFFFTAQKAAEAAGAGDDQRLHAAVADIEIHVADEAETLAVAGRYDFFYVL